MIIRLVFAQVYSGDRRWPRQKSASLTHTLRRAAGSVPGRPSVPVSLARSPRRLASYFFLLFFLYFYNFCCCCVLSVSFLVLHIICIWTVYLLAAIAIRDPSFGHFSGVWCLTALWIAHSAHTDIHHHYIKARSVPSRIDIAYAKQHQNVINELLVTQ